MIWMMVACGLFSDPMEFDMTNVKPTELPVEVRQKMDPATMMVLARYEVSLGYGAPPFNGTVGEVVAEQLRREAVYREQVAAQQRAEQAHRARVEAEAAERARQLPFRVTSYTGKAGRSFSGRRIPFLDTVVVTGEVTNNTGKRISGISGLVNVLDLFGTERGAFPVTIEKTVGIGETVAMSVEMPVANGFMGLPSPDPEGGFDPTKATFPIVYTAVVFEDGERWE